eukprot:m.1016737 g.1016737  ORF g.1016737 m.1016737 type:complete len:168 (-) comp24082_c1_seq7:1286-1789(-)
MGSYGCTCNANVELPECLMPCFLLSNVSIIVASVGLPGASYTKTPFNPLLGMSPHAYRSPVMFCGVTPAGRRTVTALLSVVDAVTCTSNHPFHDALTSNGAVVPWKFVPPGSVMPGTERSAIALVENEIEIADGAEMPLRDPREGNLPGNAWNATGTGPPLAGSLGP